MKFAEKMGECLEALRKEGCKVETDGGVTDVTLPDGTLIDLPTWKFNLVCMRTYGRMDESDS